MAAGSVRHCGGHKGCEYVDKPDRILQSHQPGRQHQMHRKPDRIGRSHEAAVVSDHKALRLVSAFAERGYRMAWQCSNGCQNLAMG